MLEVLAGSCAIAFPDLVRYTYRAKHLHFKLSVISRFLFANASPLPITLIAVPHLTENRYIGVV